MISKPRNEPLFNPNPEILSFSKKDWDEITDDVFKKVFKNSAVKRKKIEGLKRNFEFLKQKTRILLFEFFISEIHPSTGSG